MVPPLIALLSRTRRLDARPVTNPERPAPGLIHDPAGNVPADGSLVPCCGLASGAPRVAPGWFWPAWIRLAMILPRSPMWRDVKGQAK